MSDNSNSPSSISPVTSPTIVNNQTTITPPTPTDPALSQTETVPPQATPSPPAKPTLNTVNTQKNTGRKIIMAIAAVIILLIIALIAFFLFIVQPRTRMVKKVDELLPLLTTLKISTKSVVAEMDKIHFIISQESKINTPPTETTGIRPDFQLSHFGITEKSVYDFNRKPEKLSIPGDKKVAGVADTKADPVAEFRMLKDETLKTDEFIKKSQADLNLLINKANDNINANNSQKEKLMQYAKIQEKTTPYLDEAQKISNYFKEISTAFIEMEIKINSFKLALGSVMGIMSRAQNENNNPDSAQTSLAQVQVFLDQANKDTADIKAIIKKLSDLPKDSLPQGAEKYQAHNIKILSLVADYFTTSSNSLQGYITSTNVTITKVKTKIVTAADLMIYSAVLSSIDESTVKADARFVSDLQTLVGEEKSLVTSFWQNNTIIASGSLIEGEISNYEKTLNTLRKNNMLPWIK